MNYEPNTEQWRWDDLVIHDADQKHPKMLMKVVGFTRDGLVKTQYLDPRGVRNGGHSRQIWANDMKYLHDPNRFCIPTKGVPPRMAVKAFEQYMQEWDMMVRWNKTYQVGQEVRTTSDDGGFVTFTGGPARMYTTYAHIWLVHTLDHRGGWWSLRFVEPITVEKAGY